MRFIWWVWNGAKRPPTLRQGQTTRAVSPSVGWQKPYPPSPFSKKNMIATKISTWLPVFKMAATSGTRNMPMGQNFTRFTQNFTHLTYFDDLANRTGYFWQWGSLIHNYQLIIPNTSPFGETNNNKSLNSNGTKMATESMAVAPLRLLCVRLIHNTHPVNNQVSAVK